MAQAGESGDLRRRGRPHGSAREATEALLASLHPEQRARTLLAPALPPEAFTAAVRDNLVPGDAAMRGVVFDDHARGGHVHSHRLRDVAG